MSALTITTPVPAAFPMVMLLKPSVRLLDDAELTVKSPAGVTRLQRQGSGARERGIDIDGVCRQRDRSRAARSCPGNGQCARCACQRNRPAPLAAAIKLAPSLSVMNTPLVPVLAEIVPAVVKMGVAAAPMLAPTIAGVVRLIVPVPTFNNVPAVCVMSPPVALPPVLVATMSVPPEPAVISRSAAVPVPPPAALR